MNRTYKVGLIIEEIEEAKNRGEKVDKPLELAAFQSIEEAQIFCQELAQRFSVRATGEVELLEEILTPDQFSAGD